MINFLNRFSDVLNIVLTNSQGCHFEQGGLFYLEVHVLSVIMLSLTLKHVGGEICHGGTFVDSYQAD